MPKGRGSASGCRGEATRSARPAIGKLFEAPIEVGLRRMAVAWAARAMPRSYCVLPGDDSADARSPRSITVSRARCASWRPRQTDCPVAASCSPGIGGGEAISRARRLTRAAAICDWFPKIARLVRVARQLVSAFQKLLLPVALASTLSPGNPHASAAIVAPVQLAHRLHRRGLAMGTFGLPTAPRQGESVSCCTRRSTFRSPY
jgi:hypothetical protein